MENDSSDSSDAAAGHRPRVLDYERGEPSRQRVSVIYMTEGLTSVGVNLLQVGIFFYTAHVFNWGLRENLLLATGAGVAYTLGALLAGPIFGVLGRRRGLIGMWTLMAGLALVAFAVSDVRIIIAAIVAHTLVNGMNWPALESLISSGVGAKVLSRRLATYNLVWSGSGALTVAGTGSIIHYAPSAYFVVVAGVHLLAVGLMLGFYRSTAPSGGEAHVRPEPELVRARTLALWLSRIAMPAAFMINYALMAMMPSLPVMQELEPAQQTLAGSTWLAARWAAFLMLGWSVWWHTRPRALLAAGGLMLVAFLGVAVPPSALLGITGIFSLDLLSMQLWQVALGLAIGTIYTASLYFGMVLSEGSTEHGGYHEALIGLGSVLGPGSAFIAQAIRPGEVYVAVGAVAGVIALSLAGAGVASVKIGRNSGSG
jgi:hypothetical protein